MTPRSRAFAFGGAGALVAAGIACVAVLDGLAAEVAAIALITAGLGTMVLLVFLEVGLSEDRARAEEERRRERLAERPASGRRISLRRRPRRPG